MAAVPLRIVLIIVGAIVVRALIHRTVRRLVSRVRRRQPRRTQRVEALGSVLRSTGSAMVLGIASLLVLGELGLNLAPLLASAGIAGLALGFGAQHLVKDVVAGLFMLIEDQYGVGDVVQLGDLVGTVEEIGLRITTLRDDEGVLWYLRNGEIIRVGNRSQGAAR